MTPFWRFGKYMLQEKAALFWAMVCAFFSAGGLAAGLVAMLPIVKIILNPAEGRSLADMARQFNADDHWLAIPDWIVQQLPADQFAGVALLLLALVIFTLVGGLANFLHQYLSQTVTARAIARVRQDAFDHVLLMPLGRVMSRGPSEFVARIVRDTAELQRGMIALVSKTVAGALKGLGAGLVALAVDWRLTLITIPTAIVLALVLRKLGKRIRRGTRGSLKAQESLLRVATETLQGLRAVKVNTAEPDARARFARMNDEAVQHELKVRTARAASGPVLEALAALIVIAIALVAVREILSGRLELERVALALGSLAVAGASLRPLSGLVNDIQAASAPAQRLVDLLDEPMEVDGAGGAKRRAAAPRHARSIEFENVSFTYPGAESAALRGVSLNILHGERVAIVGPNGCGKTTLLSMIPRLLIPDAGRIAIDGADIAGMDLLDLRRQIGMVTQETVLFRGSIASNIAFGLHGVTRGEIVQAARRAHADEFIDRFTGSDGRPGGYDTDVQELGASLSGGQRQRLAIARAILRDPAILILDEATSQIDAESEAHISDALTEFCARRTALIIAHRLSTVRLADRIVVMDAGRIVDQGTHEQLLERCELYRRLSRTQLVGAG